MLKIENTLDFLLILLTVILVAMFPVFGFRIGIVAILVTILSTALRIYIGSLFAVRGFRSMVDKFIAEAR